MLLTASLEKTGVDKTVAILVATSGDTGKAALEGFADVAGTKICVFYPDGGISNIQRRQMTTQSGNNVMVTAVSGNFDDAQNGVKRIFTDQEFAALLDSDDMILSSANSINWGRLAPQIAYYVSAYCDMIKCGKISLGDKINIVVPTGNFGNILAAYFAKNCGIPVSRLICASNQNNVLTDFIKQGVYDKHRDFYVTDSPSMDILISSNLERLLYLLCGKDDKKLREFMDSLSKTGKYELPSDMLSRLQAEFEAGYANDDETGKTIREVFHKTGYLCDTHTAVGVKVYYDYLDKTGDKTPCVIASTASPFKFSGSVLRALGAGIPADDFEMLAALERISGVKTPENLFSLYNKKERFNGVVEPENMKNTVYAFLKK